MSLVIREEEKLFLPDGATDGAPILILVKDGAFRREVVSRIETGVAEELEDIAVKAVGTGLGHDVDDAAGETAILGIDVARQDAELGNGVEVGNDAGLLTDRLLHAYAVQIEGIVRFALSVDGKLTGIGLTRCGNGAEAASGAGIGCTARRDRDDTRLYRQQIGVAAAVQRNVYNLLALDRLTDLSVGKMHLGGVLRYRDRLAALCNL